MARSRQLLALAGLAFLLAKRRRATRRARLRRRLAVLAAAVLDDDTACNGLTSKGKVRKRRQNRAPRRVVVRCSLGWKGSTLYGYVQDGDDQTYRHNFRCLRDTFHNHVLKPLVESGYIRDNECADPAKRVTAVFKVAVCLYFMAHAKGTVKLAADPAGLGESTVREYLDAFVLGTLRCLKPIYMPSTPRSPAHLEAVRSEFAARRGIPNVVMAVDGTHLPFYPHETDPTDYRNYKGWESILDVSFVDSFHLFVESVVGAPGRAGDNTVLRFSSFMKNIRDDPEAWLGLANAIAGDGGASDGDQHIYNPIPDAREPIDCYHNFCFVHSYLYKALCNL